MKTQLTLLVFSVLGASLNAAGEMVEIPAFSSQVIDGATGVPVKLTADGFLISKTEVTQTEFQKVMGYNPSHYAGGMRPVENVSWWEAIRYCNVRSSRDGLQACYDLATGVCNASCNGYRLPTAREWERARGNEREYPLSRIHEFAYLGSSETKSKSELMGRVSRGTEDVANRSPNSFGLFDMLGNVWEWCDDYQDPDTGRISSFVQPSGPSWGPERVLCGGSFITIQGHWSRSFRSSMCPDFRSRFTGFRVVRNLEESKGRVDTADESWLQTFSRAPTGFERNIGGLSSLLGNSPGKLSTSEEWEKKRRAVKMKWERLLGVPAGFSSEPSVRIIRTFCEPHYTGKMMYLQVEPDAWEKIYLMIPVEAIEQPVPAVIVPYYDIDTPAGKNLGGRSYRPPSVRSFANLLVRQGYIAVAVRWFGESYGENYAEAVANLKLRLPECTGLGKWVSDARRVVDYLCTLPEVDRDRIGMIGHSLGAKMTLYAAAMDERIDVAVASEGGIGLDFSNYDDYWYWGEDIRNIPEGTDHHELLGLIAPRPFLLIGGDDADNDQSWYYINAAREVYGLYRKSGVIGYFNHRSGHSPTPESVHLALEWFKYFFENPTR